MLIPFAARLNSILKSLLTQTDRNFLLLFLVLGCSYIANAQSNSVYDCLSLKKYKLQYLSIKDNSAYVLLSADSALEYHSQGKYHIKAKLTWINDCEYNMTLSEVTIPGFAYQIGNVMNVRIDKIVGTIVYYVATINGDSWAGQMKIVK